MSDALPQFDANGTLVNRYGPEDLNGPHHDAALSEFTAHLRLARYRQRFPFLAKLTDAELADLIERGKLQLPAKELKP